MARGTWRGSPSAGPAGAPGHEGRHFSGMPTKLAERVLLFGLSMASCCDKPRLPARKLQLARARMGAWPAALASQPIESTSTNTPSPFTLFARLALRRECSAASRGWPPTIAHCFVR